MPNKNVLVLIEAGIAAHNSSNYAFSLENFEKAKVYPPSLLLLLFLLCLFLSPPSLPPPSAPALLTLPNFFSIFGLPS